MAEEIDDAEIEQIYAEAESAAIHAWGPLGAPSGAGNPYPEGGERAEIWSHAFRNAYASENGY